MGQQPNIELTDAELPRSVPTTPPARHWRAARLGVPTSPEEVPRGGMFGQPAPDGGWAMRIISAAELPGDDSNLELVLSALMVARAAALGRGPTLEDLEVALILCGYGYEAKPEVIARRDRWIKAVSHDIRPGETAVSEVDVELIVNKPEQVRWALSHSGDNAKHEPS